MSKLTRLAEPGSRPKLVRPSEEMKRLSAALCEELQCWPDVKKRAMFGLHAFFRKKKIFALIPDKRAPSSPNGIAFKLRAPGARTKGRWVVFRVEGDGGFGEAISHLRQAYAKGDSRDNNNSRAGSHDRT